jgi:hypothetical protein
MGKKKNGSSTPRCKRMRRQGRLQVAKHWLTIYPGKNIVRGYARHFAVDLLCAVKELEMLGNQFKPEYIDQLKRTIAGQIEQKQERKRLKMEEEMISSLDSDDEFCFIAGYTSGGASYGVTWEEMDRDEGCSCSNESYLFEDQLDNMDMDETEEPNSEDIDESKRFLDVKKGEEEIPF